MGNQNPTVIVGHLDTKELEKSIDDIVSKVANASQTMATKFERSMDIMKSAMSDFAVTQKVSAQIIKESWKDITASFDAMLKAQSAATRSSGSRGGAVTTGDGSATSTSASSANYDPNTVGWLEQIIALEKKRRKEIELTDAALKKQNDDIAQLKNLLQKATESSYSQRLRTAFSMSAMDLSSAEQKLAHLRSLQQEFANGTKLSVTQQNRLNKAIEQTEKQIATLKSKAPKTLKDVLGMDESSLDAITRKMQALKRVQIDPKNEQQVKDLAKAYQDLKTKQNEMMGQNNRVVESNFALARSFNYIRNRLVYALTIGALMNFTKNILEIRGQYELLERSLGVLVNSFERGSQIFRELNEMAIKSPFTLIELGTAAKQLTAYNFAANEVVDTTRRLADISAALGVPMERLTYNLGQIRAQTALTARDARDFANAGLPIVQSLAEHFTELEGRIVTTGDVYDRMSKKMVSYNDVMSVLNKMTDEGGKFFEFQAKQAETLKVQMANLTLAVNNMYNEIGASNQGVLSSMVGGLKTLFQNWKTINRLLKDTLLLVGMFKASSIVYAYYANQVGKVNVALKSMYIGGQRAIVIIKQLGMALKSVMMNPAMWGTLAIFTLIDTIQTIREATKAVAELNEEIRKSAKEASDSILNYLGNKGNKATRELAYMGKLTAEQGEKAWGSLREQIEQSASSSDKLIAELLKIEDINERVKIGFNYVENIQKAQATLQDLRDDTIKITADYGFGGMFGEGLVSDLKDFNDEIQKEIERSKINTTSFVWGRVQSYKNAESEFRNELEETANSINNFIQAYNITDPIQIQEILNRVKAQIKAKNPEIKGELAKIFDIELDKRMFLLTDGAVEKNASLWAMFMERLKHSSSQAFQDVNDDWIRKNKELSPQQKKAIDDNLQYFKDSMPYAYDAVEKMVQDASNLKIHIGITFSAENDTAFQKEIKQRIEKASSVLDFGGTAFLPTQKDTYTSYVKGHQDAIKKLREDNAVLARDNSQYSKDRQAENKKEIEQRLNILKLLNQPEKAEKKTKGRTTQKDVLGDALQKEVEIVSNLTKKYKEYWAMGVNSTEAIDKTAQEYNNTLNNVNNTLAKFGIAQTKSVKELAHLGLQDIKAYYESLLVFAKQKGNTKGIEAIEKAIANLNTEITKQDYKTYADSLNSELSKIKDEYELSLDLEANPELGQSFMDLMGIVPEQLPKTLKQYADRLVFALNEYIKKAKVNLPKFTSLNLTDDDLRFYENLVEKQELTKVAYDEIVKAVKMYREAAKKEFDTDINNWNKLIEKYGELEYKIQKIQKDAAQERLAFIKQFGNDNQQAIAIDLKTQLDTETDPQKRQGLIDDLKALTTEVAGTDAARIDVKIAIDNSEVDKISEETFKEFQKTPEWMIALGDLSGLTHKALGTLIKDIRAFASANKNLSDKDLRKIAKTIKQLQEAQRKDNPFLRIKDAIEKAREQVKPFEEKLEGLKKELKEYQKQAKNTTGNQDGLNKKIKDTETKIEQTKKQIRLFRQVSIKSILEGIQEIKSAADTVISSVADMFAAFGNEGASEALKVLSSVVDKAMQFAQIGASIGGGWGAAIGGILGGLMGLFTSLADIISGNAKITKQVEESERDVKRLENSYKNLEKAIEKAFGAAQMGAKQASIANKQLQLLELERQLALERSRRWKNQDKDKILDLTGQVIDLNNEISDMVDEVANSFLGISSVSDAVSDMVGTIIDALRNGENAMDNFNESINDMIANMIKQVVMANVIGPKFQAIWDSIQDRIQGRISKEAAQQYVEEKTWFDNITTQVESSDKWIGYMFNKQDLDDLEKAMNDSYQLGYFYHGTMEDIYKMIEYLQHPEKYIKNQDYLKQVQDAIKKAQEQGGIMGLSTEDLIEFYAGRDTWGTIKEYLSDYVNDSETFLKSWINYAMQASMGNIETATYEEWKALMEERLKAEEDALNAAATPTMGDIRTYADELRSVSPEIAEYMDSLQDLLREYGLIKDTAQDKALSLLQQGIQGITEDTGGAIESYLNIMSQKVFEQNDTLVQIRDAVQAFDYNAQLGTLSGILLQLQSSYQTQQAIQNILEGTLTPSGRAFMVELNA